VVSLQQLSCLLYNKNDENKTKQVRLIIVLQVIAAVKVTNVFCHLFHFLLFALCSVLAIIVNNAHFTVTVDYHQTGNNV